jgi:DNA-binding MarR family transcriptional regulator
MSSIRDFLGVTHAPVVRALGTLGKRGFLVQDQNPDDARSKLVSLTPKGIAILRADPILKVVKLLSVLPEIEREQFKRTVRSMAMNMGSSDILDDEKNTTD